MENVLEAEALQAGREGERVLRHIARLHDAKREPFPPNRHQRSSEARIQSRHATVPLHLHRGNVDADVMRTVMNSMTLPNDYVAGGWPAFDGDAPTASDMAALLTYVKATAAKLEGELLQRVVPHKIVLAILLRTKEFLQTEVGDNALVEINIKRGRVVIIGDTHGQLNDFLWILRAHGLPANDNVYLINGDVSRTRFDPMYRQSQRYASRAWHEQCHMTHTPQR